MFCKNVIYYSCRYYTMNLGTPRAKRWMGRAELSRDIAADLAAFQKARKAIRVAPRPAESLNDGEDDDSVIDARLKSVDLGSNVETKIKGDPRLAITDLRKCVVIRSPT